MTAEEWHAVHNCQHAHCPLGCDKPQPFMDGESLLCGRCASVHLVETEMMPCTPATCGELEDERVLHTDYKRGESHRKEAEAYRHLLR